MRQDRGISDLVGPEIFINAEQRAASGNFRQRTAIVQFTINSSPARANRERLAGDVKHR